MLNPYEGIDWSSVNKLLSLSHKHCTTQEVYDSIYSAGIRHAAVSNYWPSEPWYPLNEHFDTTNPILGSPNAEHHNAIDAIRLHCNGLGSTFSSGVAQGQTPIGLNTDWRDAFRKILAALQYADGGGITVNHPVWSGLETFEVETFLKYSPFVLGIEIYNHTCQVDNGMGFALSMWDAILSKAIKTWGFCVPDWASPYYAHNVMLVAAETEEAVLNAYRSGAFYGQLNGGTLNFTEISVDSTNLLTVETDTATEIKIISDGEVVSTVSNSSCTLQLDGVKTYYRIEASNAVSSIYSQPIMFKVKDFWQKKKASNILLFG